MKNHPLSLSAALLLSAACGVEDARRGDCGPVLSMAECQALRTQLGVLPKDPPRDPTNGYTQNADARLLGQALFFDTCLSEGQRMSCATCHIPRASFADPRSREVKVPVVNGSTTLNLAPIVNPTPERLMLDPAQNPDVRPQRDLQGNPLAEWKPDLKTWVGVQRRGQASPSAADKTFTGRNTPTLYNLSYGAGVAPTDGDRSYGVTWSPLDGRYDSVWALSAEVFEFGAVQRTNRAYLAQRLYRHAGLRELYNRVFRPLPDLDRVDTVGPGAKRYYPKNASPATGFNGGWVSCWNNGKCDLEPDLLTPIDPTVKDELTQILANAGKALGAYLSQLRSNRSPYDRFVGYWDGDSLVKADPTALTTAQQRGLRLFLGKAECVLCHSGPNFTDGRFHNLGVPEWDAERRTNGANVITADAAGPVASPPSCQPGAAPSAACPDLGHFAWQNRLANRCRPDLPMGVSCQNSSTLACGGKYNLPSGDAQSCLPPTLFDRCDVPGAAMLDAASLQRECARRPACVFVSTTSTAACVPAPTERDRGAFKTPSLRNAERTWPYMHNGAISDGSPAAQTGQDGAPHLVRLVQFYNQGGGTPVVGRRDPILRPLNLTDAEIADLVEFLKALTDDTIGTHPEETSPPTVPDSPCPS